MVLDKERFSLEREALIERLRRRGIVKSKAVHEALLKVPREEFVWPSYEEEAYIDTPLPLGHTGQTISAPHMVAIMLEELELRPGDHVLEIGAGSGYNAALMAEIVKEGGGTVVTIEIVKELADFAKRNLEKLGYDKYVKVVYGDGTLGYPPCDTREIYDRITVTAAAPRIPRYLFSQLKSGGIMLIPVGDLYSQNMLKVRKEGGKIKYNVIIECIFVPLVGADGWKF